MSKVDREAANKELQLLSGLLEREGTTEEGKLSDSEKLLLREIVFARQSWAHDSVVCACAWQFVLSSAAAALAAAAEKPWRLEVYFLFPASRTAVRIRSGSCLVFYASQMAHHTAVPVVVAPDGSVTYLGLDASTGGEGATADQLEQLPVRILAWGASSRRRSSGGSSSAGGGSSAGGRGKRRRG